MLILGAVGFIHIDYFHHAVGRVADFRFTDLDEEAAKHINLFLLTDGGERLIYLSNKGPTIVRIRDDDHNPWLTDWVYLYAVGFSIIHAIIIFVGFHRLYVEYCLYGCKISLAYVTLGFVIFFCALRIADMMIYPLWVYSHILPQVVKLVYQGFIMFFRLFPSLSVALYWEEILNKKKKRLRATTFLYENRYKFISILLGLFIVSSISIGFALVFREQLLLVAAIIQVVLTLITLSIIIYLLVKGAKVLTDIGTSVRFRDSNTAKVIRKATAYIMIHGVCSMYLLLMPFANFIARLYVETHWIVYVSAEIFIVIGYSVLVLSFNPLHYLKKSPSSSKSKATSRVTAAYKISKNSVIV